MLLVESAAATGRESGTAARILDAAAQLLAERGYGGLRMQDVASEAGVRPAAIYYYYPSREALIEEVLAFGMSRLRQHAEQGLSALTDDVSARDRLLHLVELHLRYELSISHYVRASIRNAGQVPPEVSERQRREFRAYRDLWARTARAAALEAHLPEDPSDRIDLMLVIGALNWTVEWWRPEQGDLEALIAQAQTFVRHGLLTPDRRQAAPPAPGPTPPSTGSSETRDRILAATAATLRARGYAKTHLSEIAERASVQAPAIYHYFSSREGLITTVLTEGQHVVADHMDRAVETLAPNAGPRAHTAILTDAYLRVELELSDFATAMTRNVGQVPPRMRQALSREGDRLTALWQAPFDVAAGTGDLRPGVHPTVARMLVIGALTWVAEWWRPGTDVNRIVEAAQRVVGTGFFTDTNLHHGGHNGTR